MARVINVAGEVEIYETFKVGYHYSFPIVATEETFLGLPKGAEGLLLVNPRCKIKFSVGTKIDYNKYILHIIKFDACDKQTDIISAIVDIRDINNIISTSKRVKE